MKLSVNMLVSIVIIIKKCCCGILFIKIVVEISLKIDIF